MQALGEASMCWHPRPAGVFDAQAAAEVGERFLASLEKDASGLPRWAEGALFALGMGNMGHSIAHTQVPLLGASMQVTQKRPSDLEQLLSKAPMKAPPPALDTPPKIGAMAAEEVAKGMRVEKEHNKDDAETKKIVEDHLREHPDYYTRLEQCFGKAADHPVDRAMERTQIDPAYIKDLRQFIRAQPDLPKIPLYHPLRGGFQGYATFTPAGKHHVVSTVLSPAMKPKGVPLSSVLAGVKVPEPKLRKEKHA